MDRDNRVNVWYFVAVLIGLFRVQASEAVPVAVTRGNDLGSVGKQMRRARLGA